MIPEQSFKINFLVFSSLKARLTTAGHVANDVCDEDIESSRHKLLKDSLPFMSIIGKHSAEGIQQD